MNSDMISLIKVLQVYKFIHNTVGHYVHTYTQLHTCTIYKHTYQDQCIIKYFHKYRSKLHYFRSHTATYMACLINVIEH